MKRFLKNLFGVQKSSTTSAQRRPRRAQLSVEGLEERQLMTLGLALLPTPVVGVAGQVTGAVSVQDFAPINNVLTPQAELGGVIAASNDAVPVVQTFPPEITQELLIAQNHGVNLGNYISTGETAIPGAQVYTFEHGAIYFSQQTGAHEVHGVIWDTYRNGSMLPVLGLPTTDEQPVTGGRVSHFQIGSIYYNGSTNQAFEVQGLIQNKYLDLGGPDSYLGMPTSNELDIPGGKVSNFEGGKIVWKTGDAEAFDVSHVSSMTFSSDRLDLGDVYGWAQITISDDGSYHLTGHFHNDGIPSYNVKLGLVVPGLTSSYVFQLAQDGHLPGTLEFGAREFNLNVSGNDPTLAANWGDLEGSHASFAATTDGDWNSVVGQLTQASGVVLRVAGLNLLATGGNDNSQIPRLGITADSGAASQGPGQVGQVDDSNTGTTAAALGVDQQPVPVTNFGQNPLQAAGVMQPPAIEVQGDPALTPAEVVATGFLANFGDTTGSTPDAAAAATGGTGSATSDQSPATASQSASTTAGEVTPQMADQVFSAPAADQMTWGSL
jgi:hypothetical protein